MLLKFEKLGVHVGAKLKSTFREQKVTSSIKVAVTNYSVAK